MSKRLRVQVTVTYPMMVAMEVLSEKNGITLAAQATMSLRQALARTIESAEVERRVRAHNASRTRAEWQDESVTEHITEELYERVEATRGTVEAAIQAEGLNRGREVHTVAGKGLA